MTSTPQGEGHFCAAAALLRNPLPEIPALTAAGEIDVEALGGADLETYVNYPGIQDGQLITVVWRGADALGGVEGQCCFGAGQAGGKPQAEQGTAKALGAKVHGGP